MKIDFKKYSSIKIGGVFDIEIINQKCDFNGIIIGGANNILKSNKNIKMGILGRNFDFINIIDKNDKFVILNIGCATKSNKIYNFAKKNNIKGFEFLNKIPGTLGGILKMNAGLKDENISKNLLNINIYNKNISKTNIIFNYRFCNIIDIIFDATFKLEIGFDFKKDEILNQIRQNQPNGASFGSIFKNPKDNFAAKLIEDVGLKGYKYNGAMISDKHANFLINYDNATFEDAIFIIKLAQKRVFEKFNIKLEKEVIIL